MCLLSSDFSCMNMAVGGGDCGNCGCGGEDDKCDNILTFIFVYE